MNPYNFKIPGLPPSYNKHFKINYNFREVYLSEEVRSYRNRVAMSMPPITIPETDLIILIVTYHADWFCKNGSVKRKDISNMDKILDDSICKKLGIDDSRIWGYTRYKYQDTEEFTEVSITTIPLSA